MRCIWELIIMRIDYKKCLRYLIVLTLRQLEVSFCAAEHAQVLLLSGLDCLNAQLDRIILQVHLICMCLFQTVLRPFEVVLHNFEQGFVRVKQHLVLFEIHVFG